MNRTDYTSRGTPKILDHVAGQFIEGITKDLKQNRNPLFSSTLLKGEDPLFMQTIGDAVNLIEGQEKYFGKINRRSLIMGVLLADQLRTDSRQSYELDREHEKTNACANIKQLLPKEYFDTIKPDLTNLMDRMTPLLSGEASNHSNARPTKMSRSDIESKLVGRDVTLTTSLEGVEDICYFIADRLSALEAQEVINGIMQLSNAYERNIADLSRRIKSEKDSNQSYPLPNVTHLPVKFVEPELTPEETPELFDTE